MGRRPIIINGEPWCRNVTGIERVAIDTVQKLDELCDSCEVELVLPRNAKNIPYFKNIKTIILDYEIKSFPRWTQFVFQKYVIKRRGVSVNFSNTCPFFIPGVEYLHDIYCKLFGEDFTSKRDKLVKFYSCLMYKTIAKRAKKIIAVSEYTKKTIVDTYNVSPEKITVIYNGVGSYKSIVADNSVFEKFPIIKEHDFYFTLGSISKRKNLKWIANHAELFPNDFFVISGKPMLNVIEPALEKLQKLQNVFFAGYLNDGEVKALMQSCKAFVFPSYFEGFGIPPLEALSCGAKIVVARAASLPEIYGDCAHYIDPDNPNVDLDKLLAEPVASPEKVLEKYSYDRAAQLLCTELQKFF